MAKPNEPYLRGDLRNIAIHIRQKNEEIVAAGARRDAAVLAGDLPLVRKIDGRIDDLRAEARFLTDRRELLAEQTRAAERQRLQQERDAAIANRVKGAQEIIALVEKWETGTLAAAVAEYELIKRKAAQYKQDPAPGLPPLSERAIRFDISPLEWHLKDAGRSLSHAGDFQNFLTHIESFNTDTCVRKKPSVALREWAKSYEDNLREAPLPEPKPLPDLDPDEDEDEEQAA
jgi:hypothetical protein